MSVAYKYFNWSDEARKILTHQEMYFINADRWKRYGEFDFDFLPLDRASTAEYMVNEIWKTRNEDPKLYWKWLNANLHRYFFTEYERIKTLTPIEKELYEVQLVYRIIENNLDRMEQNPKLYEQEMRKWYFKHTGIFSTSISKNSAQLWTWKSKLNFNTACVGLDLDKVKAKLDTIGNYSISQVKYLNHQNQIEWVGQGDDFFIKRFNRISNTLPTDKVPDILDQQEIRITKFFVDRLSDKHRNRYIRLNKDCISEVIIHWKAEVPVTEEIHQYCLSIGCTNVSFYKQ